LSSVSEEDVLTECRRRRRICKLQPLRRGGRRGHLAAHDDLGRERLCRYLARPAFSLARFGVRRDGLVVYRVKKAGRGRVKQRVMTPPWMASASGASPPDSHKKAEAGGTDEARPESAAFVEQGAAVVSRGELLSPSAPRGTGEAALVPCAELAATSTLLATGEASRVAPNILSIAHWNRILGGELYAPLSRVDWALPLTDPWVRL